MYRVALSEHAKARLLERAGTYKGARTEIARRLISALRIGVAPGPDLGVTVYLPDGYKAICYPTWEGTWLVATVLKPEMEVVERVAELKEGGEPE